MRRTRTRRVSFTAEETVVEEDYPYGGEDPYTEDEIAVPVVRIPMRYPPLVRKPPHAIGPLLGRNLRPFGLLKK